METCIRRAGSWRSVTPESAGWDFVSFEVIRLNAGEKAMLPSSADERAFVPLAGRTRIVSEGAAWDIGGRASVFDGLAHVLYLPCGRGACIEALDGALEIAVAAARAEQQFEPVLVRPQDLPIEIRGAGNATRQISTLIAPDFPAHRLLVVEVWTPGGNWSSYPPHKHDEQRSVNASLAEVVLEETYYYRTRSPDGFAFQRLYDVRKGFDHSTVVRDGDILSIPSGYHTTAAAPGHDLYYLNVLAGPGKARSLQAFDDPALSSIRALWETMEPDPRLPLVSQ